MSRKPRSFLVLSLLPAVLGVGVFTVLGTQVGRAQSAAKPVNWSDPAAWPNKKVPAKGDKVEIASGKEVILDVSPPALNGLTING
jgi:cell migration-inducing and hyaluronan-binding protein